MTSPARLYSTNILLFDIPTALGKPTSPNTWKVRLALNYKGLAYRTRWVPTSQVQIVCKAESLPPTRTTPSGGPYYTLPALIDYTSSPSNPVRISDSTPMIEYLERTYPSQTSVPLLFPAGSRALQHLFDHHFREAILSQIIPLVVMDMYHSKLPEDQADFRRRIESAHGKTLEQVQLSGEERERGWAKIQENFSLLATILAKNQSGEYITGLEPSFSDLVLCAGLIWFKFVSPDAWKRISSWNDGRWKRFWTACEKWIVVPPE